MAKIDLGEDGLKGFVAQHGEKFAFGLVLIVALYLVYAGSTVEGYEKVPQELKTIAQNASSHVTAPIPDDNEKWFQGELERNPYSEYEVRAEKSKIPINESQYPLEMTLKPPSIHPVKKRDDPKIYAPVKLEASSIGRVSVALPARRGQKDAFAKDEASSNLRDQPAPKRKRTRSRRRNNGPGMPGGPPGEGGGGLGLGGLGGGGLGGLGGPPGGGLGGPPGEGGDDLGGPDGDGDSTPTDLSGGTIYRGLTPGGYVTPMVGQRGAVGGVLRVYGFSVDVVSIRALIPFEKQSAEYEKAFLNATNYNQTRDTPNYLAFSAERAEVNPDDPDAELKWQSVWSTKAAVDRVKKFYATFPDTVDSELALASTTMRVPPIMLANVRDHISHSEFPKLAKSAKKDDSDTDSGPMGDADDPFGGPSGGEIPGGEVPGGSGPPSGSGDPGGFGPPGGGPGLGMGGGPGGGMAPGGIGPGGMPGGDYGGSVSGQKKTKVTRYKLVRFFDFDVKPGKQYKYRVQLLLEDPNHPQSNRLQPATRDLKGTVLTRLKELYAEEVKAGGKRKYYLRTEWSEPSDVISVGYPERVLPGVVTVPTGQAENRKLNVKIETRETKVKVVASVWDNARAVNVPVEKDVARGSVVNLKDDAIVVHPVTHEKKVLKGYDVATNTVILDYRGGEKIGGDRDAPIVAPTQMLMLTPTGELIVRDEVDDADDYRWLTRMDENRSSDKNSSGGLGGGGLGGGGLGGGGLGGPSGFGN